MSRYDILADYLSRQGAREHPMSFREIEQVIGARLPDSARTHRPWWANNANSHVPRRGWLRAGFKTARVDMAGEKLVFVRENEPSSRTELSEVAASSSRPERRGIEGEGDLNSDAIKIPISRLSAAARKLFEAETSAQGGDAVAAAIALLQAGLAQRQRSALSELQDLTSPGGRDSVDLIREDRDER